MDDEVIGGFHDDITPFALEQPDQPNVEDIVDADPDTMYTVPGQALIDIADAIRVKRDTVGAISVEDMPMEIGLIDGGGMVKLKYRPSSIGREWIIPEIAGYSNVIVLADDLTVVTTNPYRTQYLLIFLGGNLIMTASDNGGRTGIIFAAIFPGNRNEFTLYPEEGRIYRLHAADANYEGALNTDRDYTIYAW